jgi:chromosomal replication initiation ATPase DnaA
MSLAWGNTTRSISERKFSAPKMRMIVKEVCDHYHIKPYEINADIRMRRYVEARWMTFYLAKTMTNASFPQIGSFLNKDHSTVVHGYHRMKNAINSSSETQQLVDKFKSKLMSIQNVPVTFQLPYWGA